jgi:hypothetical protein
LLFEHGMSLWRGSSLAAMALTAALLSGCTGGTEGTAAEEKTPQKEPINGTAAADAQPQIDARKQLKSIHRAIPVYAGAKYRDDLTRRDAVMVRNQYGPQSQVYTLATDDSYPQVYHYYTTYLAQFRALPPKVPYPPEQDWRSYEIKLNEAMQDPFIPGDTLKPTDRQVTLQLVETEAEPRTIIRYIVTPPAAVPPPAVASNPQ